MQNTEALQGSKRLAAHLVGQCMHADHRPVLLLTFGFLVTAVALFIHTGLLFWQQQQVFRKQGWGDMINVHEPQSEYSAQMQHVCRVIEGHTPRIRQPTVKLTA